MYYLKRREQSRYLFRDGKRIEDAVDPELREDRTLFEPRLKQVLEYFLERANEPVNRADLETEFPAFGQYLTRLRILFNDRTEPHRIIQKADVGELVFALEVRNSPSLYEAIYRSELQDHWKLHAMGSGGLFHSGRWYFSGRTTVLSHIVSWLAKPLSGGRARVVTGDPGCGKSAVLGYLVVCTDQTEIRQPILAEFLRSMPAGTLPEPASIDFAINLRDRTLEETLALLADRFRCEPTKVVDTLAARDVKTVLLFDGLDEASAPIQIAQMLLSPLTGYDHLWLIVGSRRPELPRLGKIRWLDLDTPKYRDDTALAIFVARILKAAGEHKHSAYSDDPDVTLRAALAVARAAAGNYLAAFIVARSLFSGPLVLNPEHAGFPTTIASAFDDYLQRLGARTGLGHGKLQQALVPLACGQGGGLPRSVWAKLTSAEVDNLLDDAEAYSGPRISDQAIS
jgi:hypothetical protein